MRLAWRGTCAAAGRRFRGRPCGMRSSGFRPSSDVSCCKRRGSFPDVPDKDYSHRTRLQKLGVKPDWRVSVISVGDPAFVRELRSAVAEVSLGRVLDQSDAIFFGALEAKELVRLAALK